MTFEEVLGVLLDLRILLESVNERLATIDQKLAHASESRSSVEVKTSTRGVDVTAKAYDGSDIDGAEGPPVERAVRAYFKAIHQVEDELKALQP